MSNFITELNIKKVRHLENIDIKLGDEKKHLILTGKNGCGKTSVLEELDKIFNKIFLENKAFETIVNNIIKGNISLKFRSKTFEYDESNFIYSFFLAKRGFSPSKSKGIQKVYLSKDKTKRLNNDFLQYIVNLKVEHLFAKLDNDEKAIKELKTWFSRFENILQNIFNDDSFKITFDRKNYNFIIHRTNREPFDFNGLSDGYSAIIDIVTELILKIEATESKSFDCEGIVLIDEIETHLHVELQKNILPLLTSFFPNIQFIVTTHSPFVLQSIENSIVYDLERKEQLSGEKLVNASYTQIVKNYFEVDSEFSKVLENEIDRYEKLVEIFDEEDLNIDEEKELLELDIKLDKIAPMLSDSIYLRFKESQDRISENG